MQALQKTDSRQTLAITSENWQQRWGSLPVKADSSAAEVLSLRTPHLSQLGVAPSGRFVGVIIFSAQIASLAGFIGLNWTKEQMDECGELAYQEQPWLTLAELKQFFLRLKTGKYSSNKNLNPAIFLEFLSEYAGEMLGERSVFYDKQPKKRRVVLNIEHIRKPKSLKIARWMCSEVARINDQAMERMKTLTEGLYSRERELEQKARQESIDQYQARMKKILEQRDPKINQLVSEGLTVEEAIKKL